MLPANVTYIRPVNTLPLQRYFPCKRHCPFKKDRKGNTVQLIARYTLARPPPGNGYTYPGTLRNCSAENAKQATERTLNRQ